MRRRLLAGLIATVVGGHLLLTAVPSASAASSLSDEVQYRHITFPVLGPTSYSNDWAAPRPGRAGHEGNDIIGKKLQVEVAAHDGTVAWTHADGSNMLSIRDSEGWEYWYIHINNDTPGTDDGANPAEFRFFPGIDVGTKVVAGQPVAYMGDSGDAETTVPHLHFELHKPDGTAVNPQWSLLLSQGRKALDRCAFDSNPGSAPSASSGSGYWSATADGGVFTFGGAPYLGSTGSVRLASPIASLVPSTTGKGYWELGGDGGIFTFGDARFFGSTGGVRLNKPVVGMAPTPSGQGYWLVASDGGIFSFGDAQFLGSTGAVQLQQPVIGMAPTATGKGYWLIAADGGVFTFGDAGFLGSTGGQSVGAVTDLQPTASGKGYWLLTAGGAVLPFGDAPAAGGVDKVGFCSPPRAVALAASRTGKGYWVQTQDGNVFAFGDARDLGSPLRSGKVSSPAVAVAAAP